MTDPISRKEPAMQFIPNYLPYPSVRYPIYARNGMVCASSPQAAAAVWKP